MFQNIDGKISVNFSQFWLSRQGLFLQMRSYCNSLQKWVGTDTINWSKNPPHWKSNQRRTIIRYQFRFSSPWLHVLVLRLLWICTTAFYPLWKREFLPVHRIGSSPESKDLSISWFAVGFRFKKPISTQHAVHTLPIIWVDDLSLLFMAKWTWGQQSIVSHCP